MLQGRGNQWNLEMTLTHEFHFKGGELSSYSSRQPDDLADFGQQCSYLQT